MRQLLSIVLAAVIVAGGTGFFRAAIGASDRGHAPKATRQSAPAPPDVRALIATHLQSAASTGLN